MNFAIDLNTILTAIVIAGIVGVFNELRYMNGSIRAMKQWQTDHEKSDEKFQKDISRAIERVEDRQQGRPRATT